MIKKIAPTIFFLLNLFSLLSAQTIAEKKASLQKKTAELDVDTQALLIKVNQEILEKREVLRELFTQAKKLYDESADSTEFKILLLQIQQVRKEILALEEEWLSSVTQAEGDRYALWHQPETTLEQLVIDYGAQDFVYIIPPEVSAIKLSINSNLPVPRAVWSEMLEEILNQNGVGIRQLNPFLRELYFIRETGIPVNYITSDPQDLVILPKNERIAYLLTPDPTDVRRVFNFLEKFANAKTTVVQPIGREILIIAQVGDIQDLIKMADFIATHRSSKEYRLVPLRRVKAKEMAQILSAMFDQMIDLTKEKPKRSSKDVEEPETNGLKVVIMDSIAQALFLVGTRNEIEKAERMIRDVEAKFKGSKEKTIWWYTVKHSTPEDLAVILQRVYAAMITKGLTDQEKEGEEAAALPPPPTPIEMAGGKIDQAKLPNQLGLDGFYQEGSVAINPAPVTIIPEKKKPAVAGGLDNFIADVKTGTIVMVVEVDILPKLKEVIEQIDVPKKMVQIEVLLAEKRIRDRTDIGLNLLRLGTCASQTDRTCLAWNDVAASPFNLGILEFLVSRKGDGFSAFDLVYRFLLSQDDIQINANPSVITVNQVPAKIAILDELSINTGVAFFETSGGVTPRDSFTRAQYGVTLVITPTIHEAPGKDWNEDTAYITLETNVNFDTIVDVSVPSGRPIVTRRNISNEVLIPDGQTVILGGLRRKDSQDIVEKIPFLGEIPGFGKFFSTTSMRDESVEMFIFITPKIVNDPTVELHKIVCEQMKRRPGDSPDFMMCLNLARKAERNELLAGTAKMLLGRGREFYFPTKKGVCKEPGFSHYETPWETSCHCEYDGR